MLRALFAVLTSCTVALAAEPNPLTIEQVLAINSALTNLNCASRVIRDGQKETQVCDPYKLSPSLTWQIATLSHKTGGIATQYNRVRSQAVNNLPRKPDGSLIEATAAQFAVDDRAMLDQPAGVQLQHLRKQDLEPLNLQPAIIAALLPIIDE